MSDCIACSTISRGGIINMLVGADIWPLPVAEDYSWSIQALVDSIQEAQVYPDALADCPVCHNTPLAALEVLRKGLNFISENMKEFSGK